MVTIVQYSAINRLLKFHVEQRLEKQFVLYEVVNFFKILKKYILIIKETIKKEKFSANTNVLE